MTNQRINILIEYFFYPVWYPILAKLNLVKYCDAEYGKYLDVIHGNHCDKKLNATIFLRNVLGSEWRRWLRSNLYVSKLGGSIIIIISDRSCTARKTADRAPLPAPCNPPLKTPASIQGIRSVPQHKTESQTDAYIAQTRNHNFTQNLHHCRTAARGTMIAMVG